MTVTVAICTWNRSELLRRCLDALCRLRPPSRIGWEVLVVNNNCTDDTTGVVSSFVGRLPIREAREPLAGLSRARNKAVQEALGRFICWIDDDILVDHGWLQAYETVILSQPLDGIFGGPIQPIFEGEQPPWLEKALPEIGGVFGVMPVHVGRIERGASRIPFGGNMVIRTDLLQRRSFDPRLGRTAGNMMAGEEGMVLRELLAEGVTGQWVPEALVHQIIPPRMQTIGHVRRYFHDWGASIAAVESPRGQGGLFGKPLWMWRQAFQHELLYRIGRYTLPPDRWAAHLRLASMAWGGLRRRPAKVPGLQ